MPSTPLSNHQLWDLELEVTGRMYIHVDFHETAEGEIWHDNRMQENQNNKTITPWNLPRFMELLMDFTF